MKVSAWRSSCTSILIGKKASLSGSIIIGRNEDAKTAWPKHLAFNPHRDNVQKNHFKSKDNKFEMDLPTASYSYSSTPEWTDKYGVFEEDGINEYHVAMSATESAYANDRVLAVDPFDTDKGILEEAMVTVVLPYVKSAREGVQRLGEIVENMVQQKLTEFSLAIVMKPGTWKSVLAIIGLHNESQMIPTLLSPIN